jgi:hypothetical protein
MRAVRGIRGRITRTTQENKSVSCSSKGTHFLGIHWRTFNLRRSRRRDFQYGCVLKPNVLALLSTGYGCDARRNRTVAALMACFLLRAVRLSSLVFPPMPSISFSGRYQKSDTSDGSTPWLCSRLFYSKMVFFST